MELREELKKEWIRRQEEIKKEGLEVVYRYQTGTFLVPFEGRGEEKSWQLTRKPNPFFFETVIGMAPGTGES